MSFNIYQTKTSKVRQSYAKFCKAVIHLKMYPIWNLAKLLFIHNCPFMKHWTFLFSFIIPKFVCTQKFTLLPGTPLIFLAVVGGGGLLSSKLNFSAFQINGTKIDNLGCLGMLPQYCFPKYLKRKEINVTNTKIQRHKV